MTEPASPARGRPVLLYDGLCGFCDRTVRWILRVDRRGLFRFAPLQGEFAAGVIARHPGLAGVDSLVLVERGRTTREKAPLDGPAERVSVRSVALLRTVGLLGGAWRLLLVFWLIPRPIRDWAYEVFARHRYRVFGRFESCPVPPPEVRGRFLD